jgi:hypothetical protein
MVKWLKLFRDHDFINISWLIWVFSWNWWALGERKKNRFSRMRGRKGMVLEKCGKMGNEEENWSLSLKWV